MVNLEVAEVNLVVAEAAEAAVLAGDCCTENTAKKGSTQAVAEAASSSNSAKLAAGAVVGMTNPAAEAAEEDKSTADVGVAEEGVDFWEGRSVAMKTKKVHTHYSGN